MAHIGVPCRRTICIGPGRHRPVPILLATSTALCERTSLHTRTFVHLVIGTRCTLMVRDSTVRIVTAILLGNVFLGFSLYHNHIDGTSHTTDFRRTFATLYLTV